MVSLGIDPGLSRTGFALIAEDSRSGRQTSIVEAGIFRLDRRDSVSERLIELEIDLSDLIERHRPACICVESLFSHYLHPRTAITMAHARGVILLTAAKAGLPLIEVPPASVKKSVTGTGRATKVQMQHAVAALLGLPAIPEPADIADAIAVAICGARRFVESEDETAASGGAACPTYTARRSG